MVSGIRRDGASYSTEMRAHGAARWANALALLSIAKPGHLGVYMNCQELPAHKRPIWFGRSGLGNVEHCSHRVRNRLENGDVTPLGGSIPRPFSGCGHLGHRHWCCWSWLGRSVGQAAICRATLLRECLLDPESCSKAS